MMSYTGQIHQDLRQLQQLATTQDQLVVAVLDGAADLQHPCLHGAAIERVDNLFSEQTSGAMADHGTHVLSCLFAQADNPQGLRGWLAGARGLLIPIFRDGSQRKIRQMDLARAIDLALSHGAHLINISGGELVRDGGEVDPYLKASIAACERQNVLLIAAAGNDGCACLHAPALLPQVLAVGAMDEAGQPLSFSNWGEAYQRNGILAPGANVLGAITGGNYARMTGTSFATPLVTAVAGLLLACQIKRGQKISPSAVGKALLQGALPCDPGTGEDSRQFLAGRLNIPRAYAQLFNGENMMSDTTENSSVSQSAETSTAEITSTVLPATATSEAGVIASELVSPQPGNQSAGVQAQVRDESGVMAASACACNAKSNSLVYALGKIGYDFGTEARRDGFTQLMGTDKSPFNPHHMLDFFAERPFEAKMLIWTLNVDLTPIYAIDPLDPFASDTYALLVGALAGQVKDEHDANYVERVSIPGYLTGRTVRLYSGQIVPVISAQPRGLYYWNVNKLIDGALRAIPQCSGHDEREKLQRGLREFLNRIYYDFRNIGSSSSDRALNFAATNAFQAASVFAQHLVPDGQGNSRQLANISVEKSPFCRPDSDCWDVKLAFFDPENDRRAMKIVRYTIDVADVMPVTIGEPRTWSANSF